MRVTVVSPYPASGAAPLGGVEVAAARLVSALREQCVDVTVIAIRGSGRDTEPVQVIRLDPDERWSVLRGLRPLRTMLRLALAELQPDIVHAQDLIPAGYAATVLAGRRTPTVVTAHGSRREDTMALYRGAAGRARWLLARRMALHTTGTADAVVCVHPDWRLSLPAHPRRFAFIPNIVEQRFFGVDRQPEELRVLYCGGPKRIKGWDLLLTAWPHVLRRLPQARLHAPGCRGALDGLPPDIGGTIDADRWLAPDELAAAMARAAVLVLPSRFDLAPIAMCEAWAAGLPVVAAAVGGIPGLATGAARLVYDPGPVALSEQIVSALTDDASNATIVAEAVQRVESQRAESVAAAHLELYESFLGGGPCGPA